MENTNNNSALYLHALTPVHSGTGQAAASDIDLPIAREKATNWPVIPATGLKGVLRDATSAVSRDTLFGTQDKAGSLQIGDARLLCFPVRSWKGVFAYVTCPLALCRMHRDFTALGVPVPFANVPTVDSDERCLFVDGSVLVEKGQCDLWIEDLKLTGAADTAAAAVADGIGVVVFSDSGERPSFVLRFVIVSDGVFDFLTETATEVTARIKLKEDGTKTVERGALWYEEAVPAEAIFVAPVLGADLPKLSPCIQIGGNETVGRGLCRVIVRKEA